MKITDKEIKKALETGGYVRRTAWREKTACYRLTYDSLMEFGYYHHDTFHECNVESDIFGVGYEDICADDWEITA